MKDKKKFMSVILFIVSILCVSCSENRNESETVSPTTATNPFDFIGELHNEGLDAVRDSLTGTRATATTADEMIAKYTNGYCKNVFQNEKRLDGAYDIEPVTVFKTDVLTRTGINEEAIESDTVFSEKAWALLDEIISVAETDNYFYIKNRFAEFEKTILYDESNEYSVADKTLLLSSLSVGKYSNEYWEENTSETRSPSTKSIVKADLVGAARGIWVNRFKICVCAVGGIQSVLIAAGRSALPSAIGNSAAHWFINS